MMMMRSQYIKSLPSIHGTMISQRQLSGLYHYFKTPSHQRLTIQSSIARPG